MLKQNGLQRSRLASLALAGLFTLAAWGFAVHAQAPRWLVDANLGNRAELEMVKGVGPQMADLILTQRQDHAFGDWPDFIARIPGVGPVRAGRLSAAGLRINGQAYERASREASMPAHAGASAASAPLTQ